MRTVVLFCSLILSLGLSAQPQTVGLFEVNQAWEGYTMISANTTENVYLIDNCGEVVHSWATQSRPGLMSYLDKDGNLVRTERLNNSFGSGGSGGRISKYSWEGDVLWQYDLSDDLQVQHHDVSVLDNGNILVLAWDRRTKAEAIEFGRPFDNVGDFLWSEKIVELRPVGAAGAVVVWEWRLWDHLIQDADLALPNYGVISDRPERLNINFSGTQALPLSGQTDWIHFNAIDYNPALDQIVLSSRHLSEFFIIDHSTTTAEAAGSTGGNSGMGGDLLYRWGNALGYQLAEESSKQLFGPHNTTWVKHGAAQDWAILVYNNGVGRPGPDQSQVDIIPLPLNQDNTYFREPNQPYGPTSAAWTIDTFQNESFYSSNISGAQLLPNGNVLVCVGQDGKIFEVDSITQATRWHYINPEQTAGPTSQGVVPTTNNLFRALRYSKDFSGFAGKELIPMGPIELNPLPSFCSVAAVEEIVLEESLIYPNPTNGLLSINNWPINSLISVFDQVGNLKLRQTLGANRSLDLSEFANGIYFIKTTGAVAQRIVLLR